MTDLTEQVISSGTRWQVTGRAIRCGQDWAVAICGGESPHIGAVSLGEYELERNSATVSTMTRYSHRDDQISAPLAKVMAQTLGCAVTVCVGIHVDGADMVDLEILQRNAHACCNGLLNRMKELTGGNTHGPGDSGE